MRITRRLGDYVVALVVRVRVAMVPRKKFRTAVHSCGKCYLPDLNNTAEVLAAVEGEWFK
jgi:hypothetical protein